MQPEYEYIVIGAGFYGLTIAERIANILNKRVLVIEKREHIGGNAFSYFDQSGIEIHKYGSHLFHTSNEKVWNYVNCFTKFNDYRHIVWANHQNSLYPMPINLATISLVSGEFLSPETAAEVIRKDGGLNTRNFENFEDKAISSIGMKLYEKFVKNYTWKQWQTDPKQLPAQIISRLPVRLNLNLNYFDDKFQGLPLDGYQELFKQMTSNSNITIELESDFFGVRENLPSSAHIIYTGAIDRYFEYNHGRLGWRTLDFEIEKLDIPDFQGTSVVNYVDEVPTFTRIHEFKHLHPERKYKENNTVIMREYSRFANDQDEPYYPINTNKDREILEKYRIQAQNEKKVHFGGRLGTYQYLDMHMAIGSALNYFENKLAISGSNLS